MKYSAKGKILYYDNKHICEFGFLINSIKEHNDNCIVMLEPQENENVYCLNRSGKLIWKIPPDEGIHEIIKMNTNSLFEGKKYYESKCPYTGIDIVNGELYLYNWCGFSMKVDVNTGQILNVDFVK